MSSLDSTGILIGKHGDTQCCLLPDKANRHGLITGATGTGKTITLQSLAEGWHHG
jgi:Cdc6-like AAA superfamily ATPase